MPRTQTSKPTSASQRLTRRARVFVDSFFRPHEPAPRVRIRVTTPPCPTDRVDGFLHPEPVIWSSDADQVTLQIRSPEPASFPTPVLEGGLALALTGYLQSLQPEAFTFNFRRRILRMYPVTGSAVQVIRHLVHHLEEAVKRAHAVESCVTEGRDRNLGPYFFQWVTPSSEGRRHYERSLPHAWMRALFLARLNGLFLPLTRLDGRTRISGLRPFWWDCHAWLLPEDRRLLEALSDSVDRSDPPSFASRVTASFGVLHRQLLNKAPVS